MYEMLKQKWDQLSSLARAGLISGLVIILVTLALGSIWVLREDYQVLFADLNAQDASAMLAELDRMKVPYRLAEDGSAILVERDLVYKTRLKLMGKSLDLHGGVGFEIFNNADFGMTDFAQKVNFQRALQGELARTIMGFDEVKAARVHLVLPESALFKRQNTKPKASISLFMKAGHQLTPEQISGIQRLVAASVPEIDSSAVTIVDQHGIAVSKLATDEDGNGSVSGKLDTKRQIEEYLTRKVIAILDRAIGPGRSIVSIDAALNYDQIKVTKEDVLPLPNTSGQNVGAITRRRESAQGGDSFSELLMTGGGPKGEGMQGGQPTSTSSEVEFINGRRVEQVVSQPGSLRRLSVGVMVPDISDPVELAKLKEVIAMAVGVNAARGDAIVVYNHSPAETPEDDPLPSGFEDINKTTGSDPSTGHGLQLPPPATLAAIVLGMLLILILGFIGLSSRKQRKASETKPKLSAAQREQLLQEISLWAATEKT